MKRMLKLKSSSLTALVLAFSLCAEDSKLLYENNFESAEVAKVPADFLVLDGDFTVKEEGQNKVFELPGAPLDTFGALFGPTEKDGVMVSARVYAKSKGRRFPIFGVGLNGASGYKLQVSPAKKAIELYHGDAIRATFPYHWQSDQWTVLRLQVRKVNEGEWKVEGKAWPQNGNEPDWLLVAEEKETPPTGRAAIWGSPYAGTPIQYDDLVVKSVVGK
jgi:hypothetical protein